MAANKLEAFEMAVINRKDIIGAEYNPRKISESAKSKLKAFIKKEGLWSPLVVNKRTNTLVSGHQRLSIMDSILRNDDYNLTAAMVDKDIQTEVKGNVFMNNQSAMGEWDVDILKELKEIFPDINYSEIGFDDFDLEVMFGNAMENPLEYFGATRDSKKVKTEFEKMEEINNIKNIKKAEREKNRGENEQGNTVYNLNMDYLLTIVFLNNAEKVKFLKSISKPANEKYIKSSVLNDISAGKLKI